MLKKLTASFLTAVLTLPLTLGVISPFVQTVSATGPHFSPTFGVDKDQAKVGDTLTYNYNVKNDGDTTLTSVFLAGNLSSFVTLTPGTTTATKGSISVTGTDNWVRDGLNLGSLTPGQSASITFKATVNSGVAAGSTIQTVIQTKTNELPNWVQCAALTTVVGNPKYQPSKTVDKANATIGDTLTYTLKVANTGDSRLHTVFISDTLPDHVTYVAGSTSSTKGSSTVSVTDAWLHDGLNLGDLEVGQTVTVTYRVTVAATAVDGETLQNTGFFKTTEFPNWIQCAAFTKITVNQAPQTGKIQIVKFEDFNGNGIKDGSDKAPAGVSFTFHIVGMGQDFNLTTDPTSGTVTSGDLPIGTYTIIEQDKDGWTATTAKTTTVEVKADTTSSVLFGNKEVGQVLPIELPNTGPGLALFGMLATGPVGLAIRKLKKRI